MDQPMARLIGEMTMSQNPDSFDSESMARDVSPNLQAVDTMLGRQARSLRVPAGLIDRVFQASVRLLPARSHTPQIEVVATIGIRHSWWSRAALAASIAMACTVSLRIVPLPSLQQLVSGIDTQIQPVYRQVVGRTLNDMEYLLATREITIDDLDMDLVLLAADLEM